MRPMLSIDALPDSDRYLLWTLLHTALADGQVPPVEATFIDKSMDVLGLDPTSQERVRSMMLGQDPVPDVNSDDAPPPDRRLELFKDTVLLAYSDGALDESEQNRLERLIGALGLDRDECDAVWQAARELFEEDE
ncbi:MAG: TerB family tellurite resistance protein [Deltaproteobacteria bacterium]|nr:MAG: TerB family tellurite resistance protein [Deltaproteobacteria bacterium]